MKSLLSLLLLLAFSANALAYDFKVDGLCYDDCSMINNVLSTSESIGIDSETKRNLIDSICEIHIESSDSLRVANTNRESDEVLESAFIMPVFPGGYSAMERFIYNNIQFPIIASKNRVQGYVIVRFIVEKDGSIGKTEIVRSLDTDLDYEAVRLCKMFPKFHPARNEKYEPVRVWHKLLIPFNVIVVPDDDLIEDAELGDVIAQYKMGYYYYQDGDYTQAIYWLQKAAFQGVDDADDLLLLAFVLNKDYKQATEWYKKTLNTDEDVNTGDMIYGLAEKQRFVNKKLALLTDAANMGNTHAMLDLICIYANLDSYGVYHNENEAIKFYKQYKKSINKPIKNITIADVYYHIYSDTISDVISKYDKDKYLEKAADLGHGESQVLLGDVYYLKKQYYRAVCIYEKAMQQGNHKPQFNLGMCYAYGYGVEQDPVKGAKLVANAALTGEADAQYYLAWFFAEGFGVPQDKDKAIHWFVKAASQGCKNAIEALIVLYEEGVGKRAITFYRQEAENGNVSAQNILGNCYYYGDGVKQDHNQAIYWYQKAAEKDDKTARINLAKLYAHLHNYKAVQDWLTIDYADIPHWLWLRFVNGQSDRGDTLLYIAHKIYPNKEYLDFLEDCASFGHSQSLEYLACIYAIGKHVKRDNKKAANYYTMYLQSKNKPAENATIADVYEIISRHYDDIISKQRGDEDQWLLKAAELGSSDALRRLIENANYMENHSQAVIWLLKLAQQDDIRALCILGDYYEHGKGVTQDHKTAIEWYKRAADRGDHDAQNIIGECYLKGDVLAKDPQKAVEMFEKASRGGNNPWCILAFYNLGVCYYEGLGVEQDFQHAASLFHDFNIFYLDNGANSTPTIVVSDDSTPSFPPDDRDLKELDTKGSDDKELAKLACYYAIGKDVDRDDKKAVELFCQYLSNTNEPPKNVTIADVHYYIYHNCYSVDLHYEEEKRQEFLETAAKMGLVEAQYELGHQYEQHAFWGYTEDYENAAFWFEKAASQGSMDAQLELAKLYEYGKGVPQDDKNAFEWYKKAAEQGNMEALFKLGCYYSNGKASLKDQKLANECFYKVATSYKTVAEKRLKRSKDNN